MEQEKITLTEGTPFYNSKTGANEGIVKFDVNTGKPLAKGATTTPTGLSSIAGTDTQTAGADTSKLTALGVTPEEMTKLNSPEGLDPNSFTSLLDKVKTRLTLNNGLMDQRALIMKHLFDSPLTDDEEEKLPEDVRNVLAQGKDAAELQLRVINDQLQGRAQSLSSSIHDLTSGYMAQLQDAESKKEAAEGNIQNYLQMYGSGAVPFLKAKYPDASDVIDRLAGVATLEEIRAYDTGSSGSGTSNQMTDNERALFTQFKGEPIVKEYNTILGKKMTVDKILDAGLGGPGDLAIVYEFMKGLDPTSVVRETEYDNAAKSGNIFAGALTKFNGYFKPEGGFLPENVKQSFKAIVDSKLKVQRQLYDNVEKEYRSIAERQGLNPENATIGYSKADSGESNAGGADLSGWLTDYNYDKDIADAKAAIKAGADKAKVKARLLQKYKEVDL